MSVPFSAINGLHFLIVTEVTKSSWSCQVASRKEWVEEAGENPAGRAVEGQMGGLGMRV